MTQKVITQFTGGVVTVTKEAADAYNRAAEKWAADRGLPAPEKLAEGTPTLCGVSSTVITNTRNSDDHVDNITDQATDDSQD